MQSKSDQRKKKRRKAEKQGIARNEWVAAAVDAARSTIREKAPDELMELRKKHRE